MKETQYIVPAQTPTSHLDGVPAPAGISDAPHLSPPHASGYPELSYSDAQSFPYPTACDSVVPLTPISTIDSPPLQHRSALIQPYHSPVDGSPLTPPPSSEMHWSASFDSLDPPTTQSPSTMAANSSAGPGDDYSAGYQSREKSPDVPPAPDTFYLGHYGVGTNVKNEDEYGQYAISPRVLVQHPAHVSPMSIHPAHRGMLPSASYIQARSLEPSVAIPPAYQQFHEQNGHHSDEYPDARAMPMLAVGPDSKSRSRASPPSSNGIKKRARARSRSGASKKVVSDTRHGGADGRPPGQLVFKEGISETERIICEMRNAHDHLKGKAMWEAISQSVKDKVGGKKVDKTTASMQMTLHRARRYIAWSKEDEEILREAFDDFTRNFYRNLKGKFEDLGGGKSAGNVGFHENNIEAKLVEMGLESPWMNPETGVRPKRKPSKGRAGDPLPNHNHFTDEKRNEIYDQILAVRGMPHDEDIDPNLGVDQPSFSLGEDVEVERKSERVARQACDELIRTHLPGVYS